MKAIRHLALVVLILVAVGVAIYRTNYYQSPRHERSGVANRWLERGFEVGVVWPAHTDKSLVEGVTLAHDEIDAGAGPLGAKAAKLAGKVTLRVVTEPADGSGGVAEAQKLAARPAVLAVIGHEFSDSAIEASITYEQRGILFITPKTSEMRLTDHQFIYLFRLTPNDGIITDALAEFATRKGWKRIGILYGRNDHGESASGQFLSHAREHGLQVAFFRSYLEQADWVNQDFRPMVGELRKEQFDAVMLADRLPWGAKVLVDMARMGMNQPVLATDKLDSEQLWAIAQIASNNVYVASAVDPESKDPEYVAFRQRFRARYGVDPGYGASQGYEAYQLYAKAVLLSESADPIVVATTLRQAPWTGMFGDFTFAQNGDVVGRDVTIKKMQDGVFHTEATIVE